METGVGSVAGAPEEAESGTGEEPLPFVPGAVAAEGPAEVTLAPGANESKLKGGTPIPTLPTFRPPLS